MEVAGRMKLIIKAETQDLLAEYKKTQLKQSIDIVESVLHTVSSQIISFGFPESDDDLYQGLPYMDLVRFASRLSIETEAAEEVMARLKNYDNYEQDIGGVTRYEDMLEEIVGVVSILKDLSRRITEDKELTSVAVNDVEQYERGLSIAIRMLESCIDTHIVGIH